MNKIIKHLVFIFLLAVVAFFSGVFTVNQNEQAIEMVDGKISDTYSAGIYWSIPFYTDVVKVYKSERNTSIDKPLMVSTNNSQFNASLGFNWNVVDVKKYITFTQQNKTDKQKIADTILAQFSHVNSLTELNQQLVTPMATAPFESMGISINEVYLVGLDPVQSSTKLDNAKVSESDYALAMQIKQVADAEYKNSQQKLEQVNPDFYRLYTYIESMQNTVTSKESVESLNAVLQKFN